MANPDFSLKNGYIIIGDSISAPRNSWANRLRDFLAGVPVMIDAMSGRYITRYVFPSDLSNLYPVGDYGTVIYFLGMNDMIQGESLFEVETRLRTHFASIVAAGFDLKVVNIPGCVLMSEQSITYRNLIRAVALDYVNEAHDASAVWDSTRLFDNVHPDDSLQQDIFKWVRDTVL